MCWACDSNRRRFLQQLFWGGAALGIGVLSPRSEAAAAEKIRFSTWHPPLSRETTTVWTPMLEQIRRQSGGTLDYQLFAGGALGKAPAHYDIVKNGLSDMGYFTATFTPGRFPLSDVLSLAAWVDGKDLAVDIGRAVYERVLQEEFHDVQVIELNGCIQSFLWTRRPIGRMEELRGMKIRTPGGHQSQYIRALGGEPIFMSPGDVYLALESGTIDGIVTCPPVILAFKLQEVLRYGLITTFGCVSEGVVMNRRSWERLDENQRRVIVAVASNPFRSTGGLTRSEYPRMMAEIERAGVRTVELSRTEAGRWFERFQEVTRRWADELEARGLPGRRAVTVMDEECARRNVEVVACPPELRAR